MSIISPAALFMMVAVVQLTLTASAAEPLQVQSDFEGASVRVLEIDQDAATISFMPGGDPRRGWPCWWYFKVNNVQPGQTITLRLQGSVASIGKRKPLSPVWAMPVRATWSADGQSWQQTDRGTKNDPWMAYEVQPKSDSFYVAWGPPFTPSMAGQRLNDMAASYDFADAQVLCRSREGRPVPMLKIAEGDRPVEKRFGIWVQARQHAWESGSSWVAQGLLEWLTGDHAEAAWLRQHAEIFVVPIMDVDNTATGNGGKNAEPHDHNRDWSDDPQWNEVAAARQRIQQLIDQQRMTVFLDLHNPAPGDPSFFYVLPPELLSETAAARRDRFIELAYRNISSIRPLVPMSSRPKQTGPQYHPRWKNISSNWVAMNANSNTVSLCLETIWNSKRSTPAGYRAVGAALAATLPEFLKSVTADDAAVANP